MKVTQIEEVLYNQQQTAGPITLGWDGQNESGQLAAPGNYILRVVVQGCTDAENDQNYRVGLLSLLMDSARLG